jgi:hypothetical protein
LIVPAFCEGKRIFPTVRFIAPILEGLYIFVQCLISGKYRKLLKSCVFADWALFLNVQVRDELRKETLQLASEFYIMFV